MQERHNFTSIPDLCFAANFQTICSFCFSIHSLAFLAFKIPLSNVCLPVLHFFWFSCCQNTTACCLSSCYKEWSKQRRFIISIKSFKTLISCKKVQLISIFWINHVFSRSFGGRLQPIFRQFVNLVNHKSIQWYSRWNTSNRMLNEEKAKETDQF